MTKPPKRAGAQGRSVCLLKLSPVGASKAPRSTVRFIFATSSVAGILNFPFTLIYEILYKSLSRVHSFSLQATHLTLLVPEAVGSSLDHERRTFDSEPQPRGRPNQPTP